MFKPGTQVHIGTWEMVPVGDPELGIEVPNLVNVQTYTIAGYTKAHPRARRIYEFQENTELRLTDAEIRLNQLMQKGGGYVPQ